MHQVADIGGNKILIPLPLFESDRSLSLEPRRVIEVESCPLESETIIGRNMNANRCLCRNKREALTGIGQQRRGRNLATGEARVRAITCIIHLSLRGMRKHTQTSRDQATVSG